MLDAEPEANVCAAAVEVLAEVGDADGAAGARRAAPHASAHTPFLAFAIKIAIDRIDSQTASPRA